MQEVVLVANMATPARFPQTGFRGARRGANIGRTREIWPTRDGFVSFGLRGGKARVPSLETADPSCVDDRRRCARWTGPTFSPEHRRRRDAARDREPTSPSTSPAHTMQELYDIACETNLMLAPDQLAARDLRERRSSRRATSSARSATSSGSRRRSSPSRAADGEVAPVRPPATRPTVRTADGPPRGVHRSTPSAAGRRGRAPNILEFGSGAAGPIATRYFVEHGATVLRIESKSRPDFLRVYALGPNNPHGLEGAPMYDGLNVGKRNVTLQPEAPGGGRRSCAGSSSSGPTRSPRTSRRAR